MSQKHIHVHLPTRDSKRRRARDADREPNQSDLDAAARGLRMVSMSVPDLEDVIRQHKGKDVFASKAIVKAAEQIRAAKLRMGASRDGKRARDALPSRNQEWGFYGMSRGQGGASTKEAEQHFGTMQSQVQNLFGLSSEQARDFLDSKWGRHLHDEVGNNGKVDKARWASTVREFLKSYDPSEFEK